MGEREVRAVKGLRRAERRYRGFFTTLLVAAAFAALVSIPVGGWGGQSASAAYYYYNPGGSPAVLALAPATATNTVGTTHTVTATVTQDGNPVESVLVRFTVTGSVSTSGSCTTDAAGQCTFTYTGPSLPGADLISAFADVNGSGMRDSDEPTATATKSWVTPASTSGKATGKGEIGVGANRVSFSFTAQSSGTTAMGNCTVTERGTKRKIMCKDVVAFVESGNAATFYGHAVDAGADTLYVISIADGGEGGIGSDTFAITTGTGYSASGALTSGNIQVH